MIIFKTAEELSQYIENQNLQIHFVPTMGALHEGHISLIHRAKQAGQTTLCSIFVNPTQFNNENDLKHYPRTIEADIQLLIENECDILYLPSVEDIYPNGMQYETGVDLSIHANLLEGFHRPGHFDGVVQVVDRFLQIIRPKAIYLGEKDLQQVQVISELIKQKYQDIDIVPCPTLRESDGLAKSSRNQRLTAEQRKIAPLIYQNLKEITEAKSISTFEIAKKNAITKLEKNGFRIEYITLINAENWDVLEDFSDTKMAVLIAAYLGEIRLIDNILF